MRGSSNWFFQRTARKQLERRTETQHSKIRKFIAKLKSPTKKARLEEDMGRSHLWYQRPSTRPRSEVSRALKNKRRKRDRQRKLEKAMRRKNRRK